MGIANEEARSVGVSNRIRRARTHARLSQQKLADIVGVHRSAVAQWEREDGSHPTVENTARIAVATSVSFEWMATGRGRMVFESDIIPGDSLIVALEFSAQSETEARALVALRKLEFSSVLAIVELAETLAWSRQIKLRKRVLYSR